MSLNPPIMPWLTGSIAGVAIVDTHDKPLKCEIIGGGQFWTTITASHTPSADGTIVTQLAIIGNAGKPFQISIEACPMSLAAGIVAAVEAALTSGNDASFPILLQDSIFLYSFNASIGAGAKYVDYPNQRANASYIKRTVFSFIGKS
jgi:hypothetical protein